MPVVFFGHGSPMNTLERNRHTAAWSAAARLFTRPRAILAISAHWYIGGVAVTAMERPPTIHDFGGFPAALHAFQYPALGDPDLASRVQQMLQPTDVRLDREWGLDHGTWSVLAHVYPDADIPVVQLSIDATQPPAFHYEAGRRLTGLRDEGVLIVASGNIVHNLRVIKWGSDAIAYPWATNFNDAVRDFLLRKQHSPLIEYESMSDDARLAIPTPDHYLPLLYIMGAQRDGDSMSVITDGVELGSISMLSFMYGDST